MTVENCAESNTLQYNPNDSKRDEINNCLAYNNQICFKSQQKWEADLTAEEKFQIGVNLSTNNKLQFLIKFVKYLINSQLDYIRVLIEYESIKEEILILINDLSNKLSEKHNTIVKNRRYKAMVQMIQENSYFSEIEMMKRNPLLYNQLIGQYLTSDEVEERDRYVDNDMGLVKILMEGIERDRAEEVREKEEEIENTEATIQSSHTLTSSTSHWGEIGEKSIQQKAFSSKGRKKVTKITPDEQKLLKEEFVTTMYHSFLDGKDEDFDYEDIDNDTTYDDVKEMEHDAEDKYFDSEPDKIDREYSDDDDELDIYMKTLN